MTRFVGLRGIDFDRVTPERIAGTVDYARSILLDRVQDPREYAWADEVLQIIAYYENLLKK